MLLCNPTESSKSKKRGLHTVCSNETKKKSMTALEQFDKALESLLGTKAPGVSGSKVQELTKLAVQNVKVRQTSLNYLRLTFFLG